MTKGGNFMTAVQLKDTMELEVLSMPCPELEIEGAYAGDLLSWVMGRATEGCVLVTIMTNVNVVAVATLVGMSAVVICENSEITDEVINTARAKSVNLFRTSKPVYEFCIELGKVI